MPEVSRFLGIIIYMYYDEHNPPHFHAAYGEYEASFSINEMKKMEGEMPPRIVGYIIEWALENKKELISNWELAREEQRLNKIKPLV